MVRTLLASEICVRALPGASRSDGVPNGVKRYVLDLDLPPLERYRHIIGDHLSAMSAINEYAESAAASLAGPTLGSFALKCLQGVMNLTNKLSLVYYSDELQAIAELSGMPLGRVVLMQLIYEASAMCTSVACPMDGDGHVGHIRTMDWEMDMLKGLTIEIEARRGGQTLFLGSTWAGYVGVLTGVSVRPDQARHGFSVSVNFRSVGSGTLGTNLRHAIARSWPIGFLVRETLTRATGYRECVSWLTHSKLIAPCYFTVCGAQPWEACLITRCREESIRPLKLGAISESHDAPKKLSKKKKNSAADTGTCICSGNSSVKDCAPISTALDDKPPQARCSAPLFLVQPNMDHWSSDPDQSIMMSVTRRSKVTKALKDLLCQHHIELPHAEDMARLMNSDLAPREEADPRRKKESSITATALWKIMGVPPVTNDITIYGTYMNPKVGMLDTRIPVCSPKTKVWAFV